MINNDASIVICTMFRDSIEWYGHKIDQVGKFFHSLATQTNRDFRVVCLEGDSKDTTYNQLLLHSLNKLHAKEIKLLQSNTNNEFFGSTIRQDRISHLSSLANKVLEEAYSYNPEYILWVESDLIFQSDLIERLLTSFKQKENIVGVSPIILLGGKFYDTWAFRDLPTKRGVTNGGRKKRNWLPSKINQRLPDYIEMESVGSCCLFRADFKCNFGDGAFPELCRQLREHGSIYADTTTKIYHPDTKLVEGRWI